ncbi:MAG TPA: phosphatidylserine decarboxylase family protein [Acidobacteriota bacterium]|nr:phosphatidylserine decarboxylase family protein [Acidobacteriota bacterium]
MMIARDGFPFILGCAALSILSFVFGFFWVGCVFVILTAFIAFFFRDPKRTFLGNEAQVASPADGKIVAVKGEGAEPVVSIFLSIFNVHVNRAPVGGTISRIQYTPGKFLAAFDERASNQNEQNSITIQHGSSELRFVQIAGLIARRIVCWKHEGEALHAGDRVGLIRFGSRVDVFFPSGSKVSVKEGDQVKAGQTVIGELP